MSLISQLIRRARFASLSACCSAFHATISWHLCPISNAALNEQKPPSVLVLASARLALSKPAPPMCKFSRNSMVASSFFPEGLPFTSAIVHNEGPQADTVKFRVLSICFESFALARTCLVGHDWFSYRTDNLIADRVACSSLRVAMLPCPEACQLFTVPDCFERPLTIVRVFQSCSIGS